METEPGELLAHDLRVYHAADEHTGPHNLWTFEFRFFTTWQDPVSGQVRVPADSFMVVGPLPAKLTESRCFPTFCGRGSPPC